MQILVITNRVPYPLKEGGNVAMFQMLESLLDCGFDVKLLSLNTLKHHVDLNDLPPVFGSLGIESISINTAVNFFDAFTNIFTGKSYNAVRFFKKEFKLLIIETLQKTKYDIVLFENIYSAIYLETVKENSSARCVLRPHNIEYEIWEKAAMGQPIIKKIYFKFLAKRLKKYETEKWEKCDAIISISEVDAEIIKNQNTKPCIYITLPTAINVDKITVNNSRSHVSRIFHLGSMDWIPNVQAMKWFIENVWPKTETRIPVNLYIAGRNMPASFFNYESDTISISGEIQDAYEFMSDKQVMVVPLFAGSGIRIKILEGMAAGKTIITTSMGIQGIYAKDKEHVLIADNAEAFAEAIIWCFHNEELAKEIGNNARLLIEDKYSKTNFDSQLKTFLNRVIA